ncbi:MAG: YHS domain-containing protein [bacterium]
MNALRLLPVLAALAVAAAPAAAQCGGCPAAASCASSPAVSLKLAAVDGDSVDVGALVGMHPMVLLFAGTDRPSKAAALAIQKAFVAGRGQSARFVGIINADPRATKRAARSWRLGYTVLADPGKKAGEWLRAEEMPVVVFIQATGNVVKTEYSVTATSLLAGLTALAQPDDWEDWAVDPVCRMTVTKADAAANASYEGETYYFCSAACKSSFARDPARYLSH